MVRSNSRGVEDARFIGYGNEAGVCVCASFALFALILLVRLSSCVLMIN